MKIVETNNLTNPGKEPVTGDMVEIVYDNGNSIISPFSNVVIDMEEIPPVRKITQFAFRNRFTLAEKVAIKTSDDPVVQVFQDDMASADFVDLDFQPLLDGLDYLVSTAGILEATRLPEILRDGSPESAARS